MNNTLAQKLQARKETLTAAAEFSDSALDQLAQNELGQDSIDKLTELTDQMHKLVKAGNSNTWETPPKWEHGPVNGMIGKFLSQWVYLPDALKSHMGLTIPATAFTAEDLQAWGKLTRCTPLGELLPSEQPDLDAVKLQVELVKAYLGLPYVPEVMSQEQWDKKEQLAEIKAQTKEATIAKALLEEEAAKEEGIATFTV
jgi:hypothetical protein